MGARINIARVYPRLQMGGAERDILALLRTVPDTHMIVTHVEGRWALRARGLAERYSLLRGPRLPQLIDAMREAEVVHLHTINDHPLQWLAALLAGPPVIVQTLHNLLEARASAVCDATVMLSEASRDLVSAPTRAHVIPSSIEAPHQLPAKRGWFEDARPLHLVEVRRPDKEVHFSLEDLVATQALDHIPLRATIVGPSARSGDPRISYVGPQDDPSPFVRSADVLVSGSSSDSFGRTPYEALAQGTLAAVVPLRVYVEGLGDHGLVFPSCDVLECAQALAAYLEGMNSERYHAARRAGHAFIRDELRPERFGQRHRELYRSLQRAPRRRRDFEPSDLGDARSAHAVLTAIDARLGRRPHVPDQHSMSGEARGVFAWFLAQEEPDGDRQGSLLREAARALGPRCLIATELGRWYRERDQHAQARTWFQKAQQADPARLEARLGLVECSLHEHAIERAVSELDEVLTFHPATPGAATLRSQLVETLDP